MASANNQSDHNDISQPTAPSSEDQQDQSPIRRVGDKEKTEQPVAIEQEECYAIGRPGDTSIMVTDQILADLEISLQQPLPEIDGSVDLEPYHADAATVYDWAKPEAWIQEKDSEGRTMWRNRRTAFVRYYSCPTSGQPENPSIAERHGNPDPSDHTMGPKEL